MSGSSIQRVLGRNVRALRLRSGLSQEAFGDQVGLHRTYVGGVERGERNLTLQTVERLGEVLGVEAIALLIDWDAGELPASPHPVAAAPVLRAAADGGDPGVGAREIAARRGSDRPRPR